MKTDIILCGVGGQGVLSLAAIIAEGAMKANLFVRQSEVHGMSQRGGGVQAHLRLSDEEIYSDLIPKGCADIILSMEILEALRYTEMLHPNGVVISATTTVKNIPDYPEESYLQEKFALLNKQITVNTKELAQKCGNMKCENMVLVGAALSFLPFKKATLEECIRLRFEKKAANLVDANLTALELGISAGN
ncbi:MAG: indolepyruvate oxidoreductase subunit beta [Spirochaetaceae bacterium]|nr:indolepyruvate oxidoreductase subunit beta [Spirochaetaceae bacterium]